MRTLPQRKREASEGLFSTFFILNSPFSSAVAFAHDEVEGAEDRDDVGQQRADMTGIDWLVGEAEQLPLKDASVDLLTVSFGLRNATHLEQALAEIHRVLKPGGQFVCLEFSQPAFWLAPFYNLYSFLVIPRLGALVARAPIAYQYLVESIRRFPNQRGFADLMQQAGFTDIRWTNLSFGIACLHFGTRA